MPAANPLADVGGVSYRTYNTGGTSGMNSGTTQSAAGFSSGASSARAGTVSGNANVTVAGLVGVSLLTLLAMHLLGFRFAFDASVGRK